MHIQRVMFCQPVPLAWQPDLLREQIFSDVSYLIERPSEGTVRLTSKTNPLHVLEVGGVGFSVWLAEPKEPTAALDAIGAWATGKTPAPAPVVVTTSPQPLQTPPSKKGKR